MDKIDVFILAIVIADVINSNNDKMHYVFQGYIANSVVFVKKECLIPNRTVCIRN